MVNTKNIVNFGLITSLIVNATIGARYIVDTKEYEQKIGNLAVSTHQFEQKYREMLKLSEQQKVDIQRLKDESIIINQKYTDVVNEKNELKKENEKVKKEKEDLKKFIPSRGEVSNYRKLNMILTFYGADCNGCSGKTAVGLNVRNTIYHQGMRIIAVDPRIIKLHSIVKIESEKETFFAYAADTGGAIKGNLVDVLVSSERESIKHGKQNAVVTILREGGE